MQISKNFLRTIAACILLLLFLFKVGFTLTGCCKPAKNVVLVVDNDKDDQENTEKKSDLKSDVNFNRDFNYPEKTYTSSFTYFLIVPIHAEFLRRVVGAHFPAVPTPPPDYC